MRTYPVSPQRGAVAGAHSVAVRPNTSTSNVSRARHDVPVTIPRDQLYYWSGQWQRGEEVALAELARGEGRYFASATDAIRWLLAPED